MDPNVYKSHYCRSRACQVSAQGFPVAGSRRYHRHRRGHWPTIDHHRQTIHPPRNRAIRRCRHPRGNSACCPKVPLG
ncbi:mitochondrial-processing peptidase subunit beta [Cryptococcus bacillisporus CA1873]|uniref:Mitochondrial-processing peptidase subunit beta n=2 Tax=Cryptococcus gattii TaxID=552467 RepID=A0A0D0VQI6_CRYGA|nr:mitochondrial-processing peptidase subunit beta [Cryptococcus bacillisporus CA1280]KIR67928.1 mitochondrial-processing peptidase subunit beta [Cryptococcus bacillisporus CA1873]|eukprot:KIR67928.1 mitochondrial-processing peptidase subunit beta [Cryptococcus gattii CA1873]